VQRFVNSYDSLTGKELMGTPSDLERWLRRMRFEPAGRPIGPTQLAAVHHLRDALRRILAGHNAARSDPDAIEAVNRAFAKPGLSVMLDPAGDPATSASGDGVGGLIAALQQAVLEAGSNGTWDRLKACPECGWVFFDHSRNRSGEWCTMAICGSRAKMRTYRRRKARSRS
jgi:predicted RNA-binding Zn ribbon-like protein